MLKQSFCSICTKVLGGRIILHCSPFIAHLPQQQQLRSFLELRPHPRFNIPHKKREGSAEARRQFFSTASSALSTFSDLRHSGICELCSSRGHGDEEADEEEEVQDFYGGKEEEARTSGAEKALSGGNISKPPNQGSKYKHLVFILFSLQVQFRFCPVGALKVNSFDFAW